MALKTKAELLLALLYAPDNTNVAAVEGITRLEKLLFLIKKETELFKNNLNDKDFNFVPFRMGPWTQEVYDETDFLESLGLLNKQSIGKKSPEDDIHTAQLFDSMVLTKYQKNEYSPTQNSVEKFELTQKGMTAAANVWAKLTDQEKNEIIRIKRAFNRMNLRQFLRYVYKKYPDYASKSEIKEYLGIDE